MLRSFATLAGHRLAVLAYVVFALFPVFWIFKVAITPDQLLYSEGIVLWPSSVSFASFTKVLQSSSFPHYFLNSVLVSLGTAGVATLGAVAIGYALSRFRFKGKPAIVTLLVVTQMFPLVMLIAPIFRLMAPLGLTNSLTGLVVVYAAFNIPFATFLMQSFFDAVPNTLEESAMIDGCTRFGAVWRVVLPLTMPGIVATLGFVFTAAWSELLFALMLINRDQAMTFPVGLLTFVSKFSVDWGQMMAAACIGLVPVLLFFALIQKHLVRGLTAGAVKG